MENSLGEERRISTGDEVERDWLPEIIHPHALTLEGGLNYSERTDELFIDPYQFSLFAAHEMESLGVDRSLGQGTVCITPLQVKFGGREGPRAPQEVTRGTQLRFYGEGLSLFVEGEYLWATRIDSTADIPTDKGRHALGKLLAMRVTWNGSYPALIRVETQTFSPYAAQLADKLWKRILEKYEHMPLAAQANASQADSMHPNPKMPIGVPGRPSDGYYNEIAEKIRSGELDWEGGLEEYVRAVKRIDGATALRRHDTHAYKGAYSSAMRRRRILKNRRQ